MKEDTTVTMVKTFTVAPAKVFDAWLDTEWIGRWMFGPDVRDEEVIKLETNPEQGGSFLFVVHRNGEVINHLGKYLEIVRPSLLVFTWGIESESEDESVVRIEITPTDNGCKLTLTHELDPKWKEYADRTREGWGHMLAKLNTLFSESDE